MVLVQTRFDVGDAVQGMNYDHRYHRMTVLPEQLCVCFTTALYALNAMLYNNGQAHAVVSIPVIFLTLFRLTTVRTPAFLLLVATHARSESDINSWRCLEAKAFRNLVQIELVNIKD